MPVNLNKPHQWKADIAKSVDMYNDWFMKFAPKAYRDTRIETTKAVEATLRRRRGSLRRSRLGWRSGNTVSFRRARERDL